MTRLLAMIVLGLTGARADDLAILPGSTTLDGPKSSQRIIVEAMKAGRAVGDATPTARFEVDRPEFVAVSAEGVLTPRADGVATLTARVGDARGPSATATITVKNMSKRELWSFDDHVLPVLTRAGCNSGACHGSAAGKGGFRLTLRGYGPEVDYDVMSRQALGRRIVKTAPAESLLLLKPTGAIAHGGGVRFGVGSPDYLVLAEWIGAGMPRPSGSKLVKVESLPAAATLKPGDTQPILVRATYADGHTADVTRWAKFGSTDESVAKVDEQGLARVEGRGEASATVWFSSLVATTTLTAPAETPPPDSVYAASPRHGPIDDRNLDKLRTLGIPPAPPADDPTFLRRAYLDATGTLPPVAALDTFLADADPQKRAKLVDRLLESPEYVDYWAYKWSDLFLVSSKRLPPPAMWAFSRFLRESVATNQPWDQLARRIITAKGSTLEDGAANFYALHRDPVDLTESSSMAFLGMSLTCARCHNHPMEKWTQDQYYAMANLFGRVALKDGEGGPGDIVVATSAAGDVIHPRKGTAMAPRPLDGPVISPEFRGDRREALADWLARPDNPYFAKAIVNRVWRNFFGRGLIDPEDEIRATNPPSDGPLMEWLVADFLEHKYDIKHLIRTIMTSAVYVRSSTPLPGDTSDSRFLSRYPVKRLPAEVLLDAIARVAEAPTPFAGYPAGWRSLQLPDVQVANTFLASFGRPDRLTTCSCERSAEPSITQALHLANGDTINQKLRDDKGVVARLAASSADDGAVIDVLFKSALSRSPTEAETARLRAILAGSTTGQVDPKSARRQAIEDFYWATLTGKEFLFNH